MRLECAVEHGEVLLAEAGLHDLAAVLVLHVLDGVVFFNVRDHVLDFLGSVAEAAQRGLHGLVHDLQHAAACEQLVFHERDVGLDARRVAVHEESDRAGRREDGDLRVAVAVFFPEGKCGIPCAARLVFQLGETLAHADLLDALAVELHHFEHGLHVVLCDGIRHAAAARVLVAGERPHRLRHARALLVSMAGHDRRDGTRKRAALVAVVAEAVAHDERAEIRVAEAERAVDVRVLGDFLDGVARVVHDDFLRGDEEAHGGLEALHVECAVGLLELHEVQRGEIARRVVEEEILAARVRAVLPRGALAGVPLVNRGVELHARIAADVRALGDFAEQSARILFLARLAVGHALRPPLAACDGGIHEVVAHAHREVLVLEHHRAVRVAVERSIVAHLDQRPRFLLLLGLGLDEFLDVRVPVLERVHLRRAARLAAGFHDVRDLVVHFQERKRPARASAAAELLLRAAQRRKIGPGAAAKFEQHRLRMREVHDGLHRVLDALDEARAALRVFVLRRGALRDLGLAVDEIIPLPAPGTGAILLVEPAVEPHRRIERAKLVHAQPGEFVVEGVRRILVGEVAVLHPPVRDRARDAVDELFHRTFAAALVRIGALRDIAVEVLRHRDFRRERRPRGGHLDVLLFEDRLARIIGDFSGALFPRDFIKRRDVRIAENAFELETLVGQTDCLAARGRNGCGGGFGAAGGHELGGGGRHCE